MAMLPKELIDKLPSIEDLLENPQLNAAKESLSNSAITTRAREAIAHLTKEISRQADQWRETSSSELVDRLVGFIRQPQSASIGSVINGTGKLHGNEGLRYQLPLPDSFRRSIADQTGSFGCKETLYEDVVSLFKKLTKANRTAFATSYTTAHAAFFANTDSLLVGRVDIGTLDPNTRLLDLALEFGTKVQEVGTASKIIVQELIEATTQENVNAIYLGPEAIRCFAEQEVDWKSTIKELKRANTKLVVALADSAPCELPGPMGASRMSVESARQFGADLVLLRGDGLVGGPPVGLLAGDTNLVESCEATLQQNRHLPSDTDLQWLSVMVDLFQNAEQLPFTHPVMGLLDTPVDNLQIRADRLAVLLNATDSVSHAEGIEIDQSIFAEGLEGLPSWGLRIETVDDDFMPQKLSDIHTHGKDKSDKLILDLRTLLPREDQAILDRFSAELSG